MNLKLGELAKKVAFVWPRAGTAIVGSQASPE